MILDLVALFFLYVSEWLFWPQAPMSPMSQKLQSFTWVRNIRLIKWIFSTFCQKSQQSSHPAQVVSRSSNPGNLFYQLLQTPPCRLASDLMSQFGQLNLLSGGLVQNICSCTTNLTNQGLGPEYAEALPTRDCKVSNIESEIIFNHSLELILYNLLKYILNCKSF